MLLFLSELKNELVMLTNSFNLIQLIKEPTRGNVILDIILTNNPNLFSKVEVLDSLHDLDHQPIFGKLKMHKPIRKKIKRHIWHYENGNYDNMRSNFQDTPWHILLNNSDDVDEMVEVFTKIVTDICAENIPNYSVVIDSNDKPGMTNREKKLFKLSGNLNKKSKKSNDPKARELFVQARNNAKQEWRRTRCNCLWTSTSNTKGN